MATESKKAQRYEKLYPGTDIEEGQKEWRMDFEDFKHRNPGRPNRRGRTIVGTIFVPELPWLREKEGDA